MKMERKDFDEDLTMSMNILADELRGCAWIFDHCHDELKGLPQTDLTARAAVAHLRHLADKVDELAVHVGNELDEPRLRAWLAANASAPREG